MIAGMFSNLANIILRNVREHFYAGARFAGGILLVAGIVLLYAAVSFEGYLLALIAVALAGCSFTGVQELKRNGFLKPTTGQEQGLPALTPEDAGSSPGSAA
ncbi:MAG TPA: hypothetical protein VNU64_05275 [Burkholderiales bacterium]|nr:hypothetical protein [Burkholderiales bacterium]